MPTKNVALGGCWLLDSSAVLVLLRGELGHQRVRSVIGNAEQILVASISIAEISRRIRDLGANDAEVENVIGLCKSLATRFIDIDVPIAERSLQLNAASTKRIPLADALIAACAAQEDAILLHRDQHFENIPENLLKQESLPRNLAVN